MDLGGVVKQPGALHHKDAQGQVLEQRFVDQKVNGGTWNVLGRFTFTEGWNTISVSRSTNPANGLHIIADAVRVRDY